MKLSKVLLIGVLLVVVLGGVGFVLAQDATEEAMALPTPETVGAVDLALWTTESEESTRTLFQDLFNQWAETYSPGSTLTITFTNTEDQRNQILTAGLAGSGLPDFFAGPNDPLGVYVDAGVIQPVAEVIDPSIFTSGSIEAGSVNGEVYGIPYEAGNHLMFMWNKALVPEPPATFADLITISQQLKADNPDITPFTWNENDVFWFIGFVHGFGGSVFDENGDFAINTQPWIDAFQFVHDLKFVDQIIPQECDNDCLHSLFQNGQAAMVIDGAWQLGAYSDPATSPGIAEGDLGVGPWPTLPNGGQPSPFVSGRYFAVPVTTTGDHLAAVKSFLTWLSTDPAAINAITVDIGRLPAETAASSLPAIVDDPLLAGSAADMATGTGMPTNPALRCMWDTVRPQLEGVMSDSVTPVDAAAAAQDAAVACLQDSQ